MTLIIHALKTCDHDHTTRIEIGANAFVIDRGDACLGVGGVGADGDLPASVAAGLKAGGLQCDGQQAARGLLTGGGDHIELATIGRIRKLAG